jgi:rSAM/selenodomain-associated transferase 2/rSAM/selenodomain-associated transferase 1
MVAPHDVPLATIVIPVLNDAAALAGALAALPADPAVEIFVVNASEWDDPAMDVLRTRYPDVVWLRSAPGRALQMNEGARRARGQWLVFLHADTRLGANWLDALRGVDGQPAVVGGSFRFILDSPARPARWIERGVWLRVRLFDLPYGDQALFARRAVFQDLGGFRELPLMEDVDFVRRLRRRGRLAHVDVPAITSARRWERDGWLRRTADNLVLILLYFVGQPPELLARRYHRQTVAEPASPKRRSREGGRPVLAIMARAPSSPGKSRLIRELGTRDGESLRGALLRDTFASVANLDVPKAVLFTGPDQESEIRALTPFPALFLPQRGATLGERMCGGIRDLLGLGFDAVALIGSDLPTLPSVRVTTALDILARRPGVLVLGPAEDGGYYLIGVTRSHPQLFEEIPWGTSQVFERTCKAAEALGIPVETISQWYDVDSLSGLRRVWRGVAGAEGIARFTRTWVAAAPSDVQTRVDGARMTRRN